MIEKISEHVYILDVETLGYKGAIAAYVILGDNEEAAIIDPGPKISIENVVSKLSSLENINSIKYIFGTHIHLDHFGGGATLLKKYPSSKIYVHPRGVKHIINPERLWNATLNVLKDAAELYGKPHPADPSKVIGIEDNQVFDLGGVQIKALYTPGHAPHHVSYYVIPDRIMITGDSVGIYLEGALYPVSIHPYDLECAIRSLERMLEFKPQIVAFAHFGVNNDGEGILRKSIKKHQMWKDWILEMLSMGLSKEEIYEKMLDIDAELKFIVERRESIPYFKGSGQRCVYGMIEAIKSSKS